MSQALQQHIGIAHNAQQLALVDDRGVGKTQLVEQPGTVADVHTGVDTDDGLGHDFVDIDALGRLVDGKDFPGDVGQQDDAVLVIGIAFFDIMDSAWSTDISPSTV
jgi:hypothetical protein